MRCWPQCASGIVGDVALHRDESVAEDGEVGAGVAAFGCLPGPFQQVYAAELWAIYVLLLHALPHADGFFTCFCDNKWVVDSYALGSEYCTDSGRTAAGIWRSIFRLIGEVFGSPIFSK